MGPLYEVAITQAKIKIGNKGVGGKTTVKGTWRYGK
jgi:hypothetical protein